MKNKKILSLILTVVMIAASFSPLLCLPSMTAKAAGNTHTVTSAEDSGDGTLRAAISSAVVGDTIIFNTDAFPTTQTTEIILTGGLPNVQDNVTIQGQLQTSGTNAGKPAVVIARSAVTGINFRILNALGSITLFGLEIKNGRTDRNGGGVYANGSVTATNCTFTGNTAMNGDGGGVYADDSITATNCVFTNNTAQVRGGGVFSYNDTTAENCTFTGNTTRWSGGGVYADDGAVTAENCTFTGNTAGDGGGVYASGTVTTTHCTFIGNNTVNRGNGGGVYTGSSFIAENCVFTNNTTDEDGGGVYVDGNATIENCTFTGNTAYDSGACVCADDCVVTITNSIFTNNTAEYASVVISGGEFISINSIFTKNKTTNESSGIIDVFGPVYLYHTTMANNTGGGVYIWVERKLPNFFYAYNSIITGNTGRQAAYGNYENGSTTFTATSGGKSLIQGINDVTHTEVFGTNVTNSAGIIKPLIGGLADKTATALASEEIAVPSEASATDIIATLATDITGVDRPATGVVNYGAVEDVSILVIKITISDVPESLKIGVTATSKATIDPIDATNKTLVWSSSDTAIATVDQSGKVTAKAPGEVTITATAADGSGVSASVKIIVLVPVTKLTLTGAPSGMIKGKTAALKVTASPTNASNKAVTWKSSDTAIATVDQSGKVTAKAPGELTITATAADGSGVSASVKIAVVKPVIKIAIDAPAGMIKGTKAALKLTVTPTDATNKAVTWSSSNTKVATVDQNGVVRAANYGLVTITATAKDGSGIKTTCMIIVSAYVTLKLGSTSMVWNGTKTTVDNAGTKPFTVSGRTMIPVRSCMEKLGAKVKYVSDSQPIVIVYNDMTLELKLNSKTMKLTQGKKVTNIAIEVPAQKISGKTYLPLRAVSQAFGFAIHYDDASKYIIINSLKMNTALKNERLAEAKKVIK